MQFDANTPTRNLVIAGMPFLVPAPFAAGHVLDEKQADAMNGLLGENLRNNFAARIKSVFEDCDEKKVDRPTTDELQAELLKYAADYEFGTRRGGSSAGTPADPVDREAFVIARNLVKDRIKASGLKLKEVESEQIDQLANDLIAANPQIKELAAQQIEQRKNLEATTGGLSLAGIAKQAEPAQADLPTGDEPTGENTGEGANLAGTESEQPQG